MYHESKLDSPSGGSRVAMVATIGVCAFLNLYAPQPILPLLAALFGVDAVHVSAMVSATTLGVALAAPFAGALGDRIGRKPMIVVSLLGLGASTALTATAGNLGQAIGWRFLTGVFTPGIIASVLAYTAEEWDRPGAARATGLYVSGSVLGGFVGRVSTGFLAEHGHWRLAFVVLGLATMAGGAAIMRLLPASRNFVRQTSWRRSAEDFARHLLNTRLLATYAVGFSVLFSLVATFTYITFHLAASPYNLGPAGQGMLFFVYLLGIVITPSSGALIGKIGHRLALPLAIAFSAGGVLLTLAGPLWLVILGLALCSAGVFVCQSAASGYVGVAAERARSSASGLYVTFYYLGGSVGAVLPGSIWSSAGWTGCVLLVLAVQVAAGAIAYAFWRPSELRESSAAAASGAAASARGSR